MNDQLRRIEPLSRGALNGYGGGGGDISIEVRPIAEPIPVVEWVDPTVLLVNEAYQRGMREKSIRLIRKIVQDFSWRKFKPPIVTKTDKGYEVIDGQHTATATASHPGIKKIPVLVVQTFTQEARAEAFIGQNRDRLGITPQQLFFSSVAAGDEDAKTVKNVCDAAGVEIVKYPPQGGKFKPRSTIAISALGGIVKRRHPHGARRILTILAGTESAPITMNQIKAVESLLFDQEFSGDYSDAMITQVIRRLDHEADKEASIFAATHRIPIWKALTIVYYRGLRSRRRVA